MMRKLRYGVHFQAHACMDLTSLIQMSNGKIIWRCSRNSFGRKLEQSIVTLKNELYFQQDGAPPHRKKEVQDWLKGKFGDKFINTSRWPPRSPDLNPCDFSLWGGLKSKVYEPKPKNLEELKQNITREIKNFQKNDMQKHFVNLEKRLEMLINEKGGHIEHLLK